MCSRLDRLFLLLESDNTCLHQAATQRIGQLAKQYAEQLPNLLNKLNACFSHKQWITRSSAGKALLEIGSQYPASKEWTVDVYEDSSMGPFLQLNEFDMQKLLQRRMRFYRICIGDLCDSDVPQASTADAKSALKTQFGMKGLVGEALVAHSMSFNDIVSDEDLKVTPTTSSTAFEQPEARVLLQILCREYKTEASMPPEKRMKHEPESQSPCEWPFLALYQSALSNLWSLTWETRHGAAITLRDLLQSRQADFQPPDTAKEALLEDCAVRVLATLLLDSFFDFVADETVAPVCETCAQVLGVLSRLLNTDQLHQLVRLLVLVLETGPRSDQVDETDNEQCSLLGDCVDWMHVYNCLLAVKYIFAARMDMLDTLMPLCHTALLRQLMTSCVDDLQVCVAHVLQIVVPWLDQNPDVGHASLITQSQHLMRTLAQDQAADFSATSSALLDLFVQICATQCFADSLCSPGEVEIAACCALPYLYHASSLVHASAVRCLKSLFQAAIQHGMEFSSKFASVFLTQIYQRLLLESCENLLGLLEETWNTLLWHLRSACVSEVLEERVQLWLCQVMQGPCSRYSPAMLALPQAVLLRDAPNYNPDSSTVEGNDMEKYMIAGEETINMNESTRDLSVLERRLRVIEILGQAVSGVVRQSISTEGEVGEVERLLLQVVLPFCQAHLTHKVAISRLVIAAFLRACFQCLFSSQKEEEKESSVSAAVNTFVSEAQIVLVKVLTEAVYFEESLGQFRALQADCHALKVAMLERRILAANRIDSSSGVIHCKQSIEAVWQETTAPQRQDLAEFHQRALLSVDEFLRFQAHLTARVRNVVAAALLSITGASHSSPLDKWSPVIVPCMDTLRGEPCIQAQSIAARALSQLFARFRRQPVGVSSPADKVVENVCALFLRRELPVCLVCNGSEGGDGTNSGICAQISALTSVNLQSVLVDSLLHMHQASIPAQGATLALRSFLCDCTSETVEVWLPRLWLVMFQQPLNLLRRHPTDATFNLEPTDMIQLQSSLCVLNVAVESLPSTVSSHTLTALRETLLPQMLSVMQRCRDCRLREFLVSSITAILRCSCKPHEGDSTFHVLENVLLHIWKLVKDLSSENIFACLAALELLCYLTGSLQLSFLPYGMTFLVPVLACCSHANESVRAIANFLFRQLLTFMPLVSLDVPPTNMGAEWREMWSNQKELVSSLLHPSSIPTVQVDSLHNVKLRPYQQEGVNWMLFLNRFGLHGLLCDDLGLGKSLQALCVLAISHQQLQTQTTFARSLIICPASLLGHWCCETRKFIHPNVLTPMALTGSRESRLKMYEDLENNNLIIVSYDMVRKDIDILKNISWNYVVLDEGHIIRKGYSKISICVKRLVSKHRLILTGTPVQNHALDLWSLFDFLMPGFLGTSAQFHATFGRAILASRDAKTSSREMIEGERALQCLHKQVLPLLMRRLKSEVLQDLPPKMIQDYPCHLTPLQRRLYTAFQEDVVSKLGGSKEESEDNKGYMLKALMYLRKVANHPKLVLQESHPQYQEIVQELRQTHPDQSLEDPALSGKLMAFLELLRECGIGVEWEDEAGDEAPVLSQHRALVFCHTKSMLDLIESAIRQRVPRASWLRLDGSVPLKDRHAITTQFNEDPSIDLLLLTTSVGGLGLNLTGADTVIFVDNDWNPMKDLQAMDRAHRIGQKRVVNVYRFITVDTIEEKIMNLQEFKKHIAESVITKENQSLTSMDTENLFELFDNKQQQQSARNSGEGGSGTGSSVSSKAILNNLGELWDEDEYSGEFDVNAFARRLDSGTCSGHL